MTVHLCLVRRLGLVFLDRNRTDYPAKQKSGCLSLPFYINLILQ